MNLEPWHWLAFGVVLIIAEMFVPTFFLLWFGVGAVITSVLAFLLPLSSFWEVMTWLIASIIFIGVWFKFIQPNFKTRTKAGLGAGVIIGEVGMLIKVPTDDVAGVVRFATPKAGASEWVCRCTDNNTLAVGDKVVIANIIGNELLVKKI